jgi:radical SAM superfamily enzyme YgiQ (UPF0313 family)
MTSKVRVLLVNLAPLKLAAAGRQESLGLGYLAAVARRDGHDVEILDGSITGWSAAVLTRHVLERVRPSAGRPGSGPAGPARRASQGPVDVIGVSVLSQDLIPACMSLVAVLRRSGFSGHIILGGHPPTFLHRELRRDYRGFDSIVVGEGEVSFADLLGALSEGREWTGLDGIAAAETGGLDPDPVGPRPRPLVGDLDSLPPPARDTLPAYFAKGPGPRAASVLRSRGCYGDCTFCDTRAFYAVSPGPPWRVRSAAGVVDEIESLVKDYRVEFVRFWDDNFMGPGDRGRLAAEELAAEVTRRRLGLAFSIECRVTDVDMDVFRRLKEVGLKKVFIGVEAMNQRQLDFYGKRVTVEDNWRALGILESLGLEVIAGMIVFDPHTTLDEFHVNLKSLKTRLGAWGPLATRITDPWGRVRVYPGTPLERLLRQGGRLQGDYLNYGYSFTDPIVGWLYGSGRIARSLTAPVRVVFSRLRRRRDAGP